MIKTDKERRDEAEQEAQEFADYIAQQEEEPRRRKKPTVESNRAVYDVQPFNFDVNVEESAEGGEDGGPPPPPPIEIVGACCFEDGTCLEQGEDFCGDNGGEYQGDDTTCGETECPVHTGACCVLGAGCFFNLTPTFCASIGGTYQGDGSDCDPNPCPGPCDCGFSACDGSGRKFLTRTTIGSLSWSTGSGTCGCMNQSINYQIDETMDPVTCTVSGSCFGTSHGHAQCPENPHYEECDCDTTFSWLSGFGCGNSSCSCSDCGGNLGFWLDRSPANCSPTFCTFHNNCVSADHYDNGWDWHGDGPTTFAIDVYLSNECFPS